MAAAADAAVEDEDDDREIFPRFRDNNDSASSCDDFRSLAPSPDGDVVSCGEASLFISSASPAAVVRATAADATVAVADVEEEDVEVEEEEVGDCFCSVDEAICSNAGCGASQGRLEGSSDG